MTGQNPVGVRPVGASSPPAQPVATIGQFLSLLRRRLTAVLACVFLGLVLAGALLAHTPNKYQATAVVDVSPIFGTSSSTTSTSNATAVSTITEARIATSTSVAQIAQRTLGFQGTVSQLSKHVTVTSPLDSRVLNVTFTSSTPTGAADGANAFSNAYLEYRTTTVQAALKARVALIGSQVADLERGIRALKPPPAGADTSQYTSQRNSIQNQIQQLQAQINTYQTSVVKPGQVAGAATVPSAANSPKPSLYLAGGLLLGLLLGIFVAVVRDGRDNTVHDSEVAERSLGAPVLAEAVTSGDSRTLTALAAPRSAEADAYRTVATTVASETTRHQVVLLCGAGAVASNLAAMNLAITFADQGLRTVLAGPRAAVEPAVDLLAVSPVPQSDRSLLSDQLAASANVPGLSVLSLGDEVSLGATLRANGDNLADVLGTADMVVLDGVNIDFPSTLLRLGHLANEAVVVVQKNQTTSAEVERVAQQLAQARTTVLGSILLTYPSGLRRRTRSATPVQSSRPLAEQTGAVSRAGAADEAVPTGWSPDERGGQHAAQLPDGAPLGGDSSASGNGDDGDTDSFSTASATTRRS